MNCLVTGGAGFIGSHLVDKLIEQRCKVLVLDNLSTGNSKNINPKSQFFKVDIVQYKAIEHFFKRIDYVFHLAALPRIQPSFDDPLKHERVNVIGTINCFQASINSGVKKFIFSSSSACYGNPDELPTTENTKINCLSPYALQKYTAEQYCLLLGRRFGVPVIALRYFNVYGPRSFNPKNPFNAYSSVIGIFHNQKKKNQPLTITGNGEQARDFVHVYDAVEANISTAFNNNTKFGIFNIGCNKAYTINQVAGMFSDKKKYIPERKGESRITLADITRIKKTSGWQPKITLEEGMKLLDD